VIKESKRIIRDEASERSKTGVMYNKIRRSTINERVQRKWRRTCLAALRKSNAGVNAQSGPRRMTRKKHRKQNFTVVGQKPFKVSKNTGSGKG